MPEPKGRFRFVTSVALTASETYPRQEGKEKRVRQAEYTQCISLLQKIAAGKTRGDGPGSRVEVPRKFS